MPRTKMETQVTEDVMVEIRSDIKTLQTSQETTQSAIHELSATMANFVNEQKCTNNDTKALLAQYADDIYGNKKRGIEGIKNTQIRHEKTIQTVQAIFSNAKLMYSIFGLMGISTLRDLWTWFGPLLAPLIQKVVAGSH